MRRFLRRLSLSLVLVLAVAVLAAGGWLATSLPETAGEVRLVGLDAAAEVIRDPRGVPHIFADSAADGAFALGYVHAQDRFVQMELMRRLGSGRLAEVVGAPAVDSDSWMRTLGLYRLAEAQVALLSDAARRELQAYANGVNAYLDTQAGMLAPEFALSRHAPEPWRPADSLVWGKLMATILGGNWRDELLRARLLRRLPAERVDALWPEYPRDGPVTGQVVGLDAPVFPALAGFGGGGQGGASNVWALTPQRTTTGGALLVNDPHLGFRAPILWYLARIVTPEGERTGATVPGVPYTLLGHNGRIAWGFTTTQTDFQDLVIETVDGADAERYLTPGGPTPFRVRRETIRVKDAADVELEVRETANGPVVGHLLPAAEGLLRDDERLVLKATYLLADDRTPQAMHDLARAGDWDAFVAALQEFHSPQQNIAYADIAGGIGLVSPGRVPVRAHGRGRVPVRGWSGDGVWTGFVPYDELPRYRAPATGVLVNANNRVLAKDSPIFLTDDWAPPYRAKRIEKRLAERPRHTPESAAGIQMDSLSRVAVRLLPVLLARVETDTDAMRRAVEMLEAWDRRMLGRQPEPTVFQAWLAELNRVLFADELGADYAAFAGLHPLLLENVLLRDPSWCDDTATGDRAESCEEAVTAALKTALQQLSARFDGDMDSWRWERVHVARFRHPLMSHVPVLGRLFDLEIATDGGSDTVNRGTVRGTGKWPFEHVHGAGYRAAYDLSDLARSRFVIATGQSGNPLSAHYDDFLEDWRNGAYVRIAGSREGLAYDGDVLRLLPASQAGD